MSRDFIQRVNEFGKYTVQQYVSNVHGFAAKWFSPCKERERLFNWCAAFVTRHDHACPVFENHLRVRTHTKIRHKGSAPKPIYDHLGCASLQTEV